MPVPSPDKGGGLASGRASGRKTSCQNYMMSLRNCDRRRTRAYPVGDAQLDRPKAAKSGQGLPHQWRMRLKKQALHEEKVLRVGTLNVGSMTGRGMEVVDMMRRRRIDVLCVQETRWRGDKAKELGDGCKLFYSSANRNGRNGVGIVVAGKWRSEVLEVYRRGDRMMRMKLSFGDDLLVVFSVYAPQVGCATEEKECFWR
ncbi:uncharacterized protein [Centruroides vittatus]|uniref:uncharacterized protein n=1 Tax=Centruroides vittatus TaxID=120091 RepID=UPI0035105447